MNARAYFACACITRPHVFTLISSLQFCVHGLQVFREKGSGLIVSAGVEERRA